MADIQYSTKVSWDSTLIDIGYTDTENTLVKGYVQSAIKITTGAPAATANRFMPAAQVLNAVDGTVYQNTGSYASPTWTLLPTSGGGGGGGLSIPFTENDSITTTGQSIAVLSSALTTGNTFLGTVATGVFTTGGSVFKADLVAAVAGNAFTAVTTGVYTGTGLLVLTANSATTGTLAAISGTGLTTGKGLVITGGTSMTAATGALLSLALGAATVGQALTSTTTGVYTDVAGIVALTANSLTSGSIMVQSATGATSGVLNSITGGGANMLVSGILVDLEMGAATTGTALKILTSGAYTGTTGIVVLTANSLTTGSVIVASATGQTTGTFMKITGGGANITTGTLLDLTMGAATAGNGLKISSTGVYATGSSGLLNITANSATTTTGLLQVSGTGVTSGSIVLITGSGATLASGGKVLEIAMGAATTGNGLTITSTGVYTAAAGNGLLNIVANSATTPQGGLAQISGTGLTTGVGLKVIATAATLTTGFYFAANDSALNVLTIGANGHITSNQTTAPTAGTNATGISAVAVTAGSTDVCGTITTTGTPASGTVLTITFHKTYTTAPKFVSVEAANAAAGGVNTPPIVTQTATTFVLTWPAGGTYAATPSFTYMVVA